VFSPTEIDGGEHVAEMVEMEFRLASAFGLQCGCPSAEEFKSKPSWLSWVWPGQG